MSCALREITLNRTQDWVMTLQDFSVGYMVGLGSLTATGLTESECRFPPVSHRSRVHLAGNCRR